MHRSSWCGCANTPNARFEAASRQGFPSATSVTQNLRHWTGYQQRYRHHASIVTCAKPKGKSRPASPTQPLKKQAPLEGDQPAAAAPAPPPLRITPGSLRGGLKAVKRRVNVKKQWEANGWQPPKKVIPTNQTYRRIIDKDEFLEKRAAEEAAAEKIRKRKGQSASFAMLYGTKDTPNPAVLLVDGYNVLWDISKHSDRGGGRQNSGSDTDSEYSQGEFSYVYDACARDLLERRLVEYSHARRVKVVLVFDAMGGGRRETVRTTNAGEIDVVFCATQEADNWIIAEANRLLQSGAKQVLLATDDAGIKDCITGAFAVSAVSLVREISKVEQQWKREEASRLIDMANTRAGIGALLLQKNPELLKLLNDMR